LENFGGHICGHIGYFRLSGSNQNTGIKIVEKIRQFSLIKLSKIADQFEAMTFKLNLSAWPPFHLNPSSHGILLNTTVSYKLAQISNSKENLEL
jgi:hypothetical protein